MDRKFGKLAPKPNDRTLKLAKYLPKISSANLGTAPPKNFWEYLIPGDAWQMFGNDTIGDCTCAAIAHMLMNATAHTGKVVAPTREQVIEVYSTVTGYDPSLTDSNGDNPTDQGAAITDILAYWQKNGIAGHKILAWAEIDHSNIEAIKQGNFIFGGVDIGINVPQSAMDQMNAKEPWEVVSNDGGIIGGHSILILGYGSRGATCITWGSLEQMSWDFFAKYCDEAYIVITEDWLKQASGLTPSGFDLAALTADLAALKA